MQSKSEVGNAKQIMWNRNIYERKREIWNDFKKCKSEMWKQNAKVCESRKC